MKKGRVAVIGPKNVQSFLKPEFEKRFAAVRFFTQGDLKLSVDKCVSVSAGKLNFNKFDYVLILPETSRSEFYQMVAEILERQTRVSTPSKTLEILWNKSLLFSCLMESGVKTQELAAISQDVAFDYIQDSFKLPVVLATTRQKEIYVNNEKTLKNVLELFSAGNTILVKKPIRSEELFVTFASKKETFGYIQTGDKQTPVKIDYALIKESQKVRKAINMDFCVLKFYKKGKRYVLMDLRAIPDFETFSNVVGKNVARIMANEVYDSLQQKFIQVFQPATWRDKVVEFWEWLKNEIGNTRTSR